MLNYKVLNSIAHNFGQKYVSLMSYAEGDYALGHFLNHAKKTNISEIHINILNGFVNQKVIENSRVRRMIREMPKQFENSLKNENCLLETIKSASMTLSFNLSGSRLNANNPDITEYPYRMVVFIVDNRGKEHSQTFSGWGYEEPLNKQTWNMRGWLRRLFS